MYSSDIEATFAECGKCELTHCICHITDLPTYIVGRQSDKFIGIANKEQENNCFLSVVLHALINLNCLGDALYEECPQNENCAICVLKSIRNSMKSAKHNRKSFIDIEEFRHRLNSITNGKILEKGSEGDAMETLEVIFGYLHNSSVNNFSEDDYSNLTDCTEECLAHMICFNILDVICKCQCESLCINQSRTFCLNIDSNWFINKIDDAIMYEFHHCSYRDLMEMYEFSKIKTYMGNFSKILKTKFKQSLKSSDTTDSCTNCKQKYEIKIELKNEPQVIIFAVTWENIYKIELYHILHFAISLQGKIRIDEIFDMDSDLEMGLQGLIVFLKGHYVYYTLSDDFFWYKIDDNMCHLVGAGRWYDVLVNLIYLKGIIVGLIYEELNIADLSLFRLELLFLEKLVLDAYYTHNKEAGIMDAYWDFAINPHKALTKAVYDEIPCVYCETPKKVGGICSLCGFDPNQITWICSACTENNSGLNFMCDYCEKNRFEIAVPPYRNCLTCHKEMPFKICPKCDILYICKKCNSPKTPFQSCFCSKCKEPCRDGHCKKDNCDDMVCIRCK